ncbi:MAG: methyltransferase [Bacteroidetes bacterium]|nr:MAG: methyltransferase [Bacteroidota bacterium]
MIKFFAKGINFLFGKNLQNKNVFVSGSLQYLERKRNIDKNYFDYIRLATLELVSHEINSKRLAGNVAELGVYKGKFARYINSYFPDRSLYLFDTFEGFDKRDVALEQKQNFSSGAQDFSDTSVESVLQSMPNREKCIPVKGFFPDSATNIQDSFVFVSLDADLFEPIYSGLQFFYPKLSKGGYIFIHDFNNDAYKGARKAVEQFCHEENISFVPLPDANGSAIISK